MIFSDLSTWMFVYTRTVAFVTVFPLFSMVGVPVQVRLALGAFVALFVGASLPAPIPVPATFAGTLVLMSTELLTGLLLGFICRMLFFILEFAGSVIAMEAGLNMASSMNMLTSSRSEVPALVMFHLGSMIFLSLDLHHWLLLGWQRTYELLPAGGARLSAPLFQDVTGRTGAIFLYGLLMAAPIVAVTFLINLVFSVLGRAVPQMNIFIESFAFRILASLIVFGLTMNLMGQHIVTFLRRLPADWLGVARLLGGA